MLNFKKVPAKYLLISLICILLPLFIEEYFKGMLEVAWFLHLIPIFIFTYYMNIFFGFIIVLFSILIHIIMELAEFLEGHFDYHDLEVFIFLVLVKLTVLIGIKYLVEEAKRKQQELEEVNAKLKKMAQHDYLTDLPNRYLINEYIGKAIARCRRNKNRLAVMFMDLDRFKLVNDIYGHDMGDELLKQVSTRIKLSIRKNDIFARQGGDEFIFLLEDVDEKEVERITERILNEFSLPFSLDELEVYSSPSIGISFFPEDGEDVPTLIKHADLAMYEAKNRGGSGIQFFEGKNRLRKGKPRSENINPPG